VPLVVEGEAGLRLSTSAPSARKKVAAAKLGRGRRGAGELWWSSGKDGEVVRRLWAEGIGE